MIHDLKKNIETEIQMFQEIVKYSKRLETAKGDELKLIRGVIGSLFRSIKILNSSSNDILNKISVAKKIVPLVDVGKENKIKGIENIEIKIGDKKSKIAVSGKLKEQMLRELNINEKYVRKLKNKSNKKEETEFYEFKKSIGYLKFANKLFLEKASELKRSKYFEQLNIEVKKANLGMLTETYIAMMLLTTCISVIFGIFILLFFVFFSLGISPPFVFLYEGSYLVRFATIFWIPLIVPALTFVFLYIYPKLEKDSTSSRLNQELPFAVIHMGAIAGSGISPVELFRIISESKEYPALRVEIRKIMNQINLYGYDLVTALSFASKMSPSSKLSELYTGLATNIHSGGGLKEFFEKRAQTLMNEYKLEKEKYNRSVETFMDIYISVIIAAPMILMLLLIMISVSGIGPQIPPSQITFLIIGGLGLLNFFALGFLQMKQPTY